MKIKVEVTQVDIEIGWRCDGELCPIARAINRTPLAPDFHHVGLFEILLDSGGNITLPKEAINFIDAFDAGKEVRPFSFEIEAGGI